MSVVYVILLTYASDPDHPRSQYAKTTLLSTLKNLESKHEIKIHIADDGSHPQHIENLRDICFSKNIEPTHTNSERRGYGASYNLATQYCHWDGDYFLMLEDDWNLTRKLDIDPLINSMENSYIQCVRLGYIGWTQQLSGVLMKAGDMTFLLFDKDSEEPHVWSGHPRLESKHFQRVMGIWPEGIDPGSTEFVVAKRDESRNGVAWPLDMGINASQQWANCFAHIGAIQAREDQNVGTST